eukprot:CAMPEP_0118973324 /NCGR_PEP_ID=MMETSP1173-20130426/9806_1 /TAXON_ID=1034831 /ORGANISM="Rhizochromulina marina cf, Strain CCMP1243" /LENGTH=258 /DNA_ID=CAMNT_0006922957 /DNA_START=19 /DNA_END=795 /DNA_ORIENTATION=-
MTATVEDLRADLEDLRKARQVAERQRTRVVLDTAIGQVTKQLEKATAPPPPPPSAPEEAAAASATASAPTVPEPAIVPVPRGASFIPISKFAWDSGEYNTPWVCVYITLEGVGAVKESVECSFSKDGFDLRVTGLGGKNYRLLKDNLEKDIVAGESKCIVKKDRITLKLRKVKGDYSYETWTNLTAKKGKTEKKAKGADPMGGIMDMMKDMYEDGDDSMRKIIEESMRKARSGEGSSPSVPDLGGGMADMMSGLGGGI